MNVDDVLHEQQPHHPHDPTLVDEADDEVDDLHNLDPIEVLHPEQNLLAPPPDVLPPLEPTTVEEPSQPRPEDQQPGNITSPCKRVVCKQDEDEEMVEEGEITNVEQRENKFVEGIFREPEENNDTTKQPEESPPAADSNSTNESALEASKSTDTVETATTMAMGKPYYDTDGSRKDNTSSTEALLNHDDEAFLNNYRSFSEEDTMVPLKQDFENTAAPVYMPSMTNTNTTTSTIMDSKGDTVAIEYAHKSQPKQAVDTPKDAENEPPQQQAHKRIRDEYQQQQSADPLRFAVMSPITMCFNRMLGAGTFVIDISVLCTHIACLSSRVYQNSSYCKATTTHKQFEQ